jgi:16S rRNA G966 N2-methylase RsmD
MSTKPITENTRFYGDNLIILREHIPTESVDLIYLDPPFNSNQESSLRKMQPLVVLLMSTGFGIDSESH